MAVLLLIPVLLIVKESVGDFTPCSEVNTMQRTPSSAGGRWYLMAVKNREMMNETKTNMRKESIQAECSGFSSSKLPCSCTIYDFNSAIPEPFIPEYNITAYSYNIMSGKYDVQFLKMKLFNNAATMAIFEVTSSADTASRNKMMVRGLATDDHQSFMLLHICSGEDAEEETDMWFLSRSPSPTKYNAQELQQALYRSNITMDDMTWVMQTDCIYPPSQQTGYQSGKFMVF